MTAAKLERSHGKLRIIAQRPSDQTPVDTGARRDRDHNPDGTFRKGNRAAENARGKQATTKRLRDARKRLKDALSRELSPSEADLVLDASLRRFDAALRRAQPYSAEPARKARHCHMGCHAEPAVEVAR